MSDDIVSAAKRDTFCTEGATAPTSVGGRPSIQPALTWAHRFRGRAAD